jgi:hypothetical protein
MDINTELETFKEWVRNHNPVDHMTLLLEFSAASYERTVEGLTFVKPQTEHDWRVWQARARVIVPIHIGMSKQSATADSGLRSQAPMTVDEMNARIQVLSDEMDANDEENSAMQAEIDALYVAIDSIRAAEKFVALMER